MKAHLCPIVKDDLLEMSLPIVKFGYFPELHLGIVLAFHKHNLGRNEHKIEK